MIEPDAMQGHDDVADHYNELDRVYREVWGDHVHHGYWVTGRESSSEAVVALSDLVGDRLVTQPGEHLCDIGCGYGATAEHFAKRHGVEVTGFTLSAEQHKYATARPGALEFHVQDWLANTCDDGRFDRAYAIESTEHMLDKQRFFDEAFRTVRSGGRLVICAWLAASDATKWQIDHLLRPICKEGRLPGMGTQEEYRAMAAKSGFEPIKYEDISRQVSRTWSICTARFLGKLATDRSYRQLVLSSRTRNRDFILSLPRLMAAYRTGAMRYGVFTFHRP